MAQTNEQVWILAALAMVVAVLAVVVIRLIQGRPDPLPSTGPLRLLIRPLKELKPDPSHLYLGTTIARDLAASLKAYERVEPSLSEALSSLSIEGDIRKTGPRLVMNISLLSGRYPVWSGTYDGALNDLPRMRAEIVANVARTLKVAARPQPAQPPAPAEDPV